MLYMVNTLKAEGVRWVNYEFTGCHQLQQQAEAEMKCTKTLWKIQRLHPESPLQKSESRATELQSPGAGGRILLTQAHDSRAGPFHQENSSYKTSPFPVVG